MHNSRHWELKPREELRFVISDNEDVSFVLQNSSSTGSRLQHSAGGGGMMLNLPPTHSVGSAPSTTTSAEIFGAELFPGSLKTVSAREQGAIFTWSGCVIEVSGANEQSDLIYRDASTDAMVSYLNVASVLHSKRRIALLANAASPLVSGSKAGSAHEHTQQSKKKTGPAVLVCGGASSGKTSLCLMLTNYAARQGWSPIYVELDPRGCTDKPQLQFLPGTIGAKRVESVETDEVNEPLTFFFGGYQPTDNYQLYKKVCIRLAAAVHVVLDDCMRRCSNDGDIVLDDDGGASSSQPPPPHQQNHPSMSLLPELHLDGANSSLYASGMMMDNADEHDSVQQTRYSKSDILLASGVIINAPSYVTREHVCDIVNTFRVDTLLVIDEPALMQTLTKHFNHTQQTEGSQPTENSPPCTAAVTVVALQKASGVMQVTEERSRYFRQKAVERYFYGTALLPLYPATITLSSSAIRLYTVEALNVSSTALPVGQQQSLIDTHRVVPFSGRVTELANSLLGIPHTNGTMLAEDDLVWTNLAGMIFVAAITPVADIPAPPSTEKAEEGSSGNADAAPEFRFQIVSPTGADTRARQFFVGITSRMRVAFGATPHLLT